ncbi:glycosyltransferase [Parasphingorhabdus halotolerans]|uniref:Glycosyltransferase n=1 Tax=Parasphingorhabdus halotolerans TaxID=2725558 RepID=A0A6H2DK05_9SPHN|nr:glycosyltransferase [Parasphingorhabdus halotolerans]QJB68528.1 glycosyltransferase [Parasphingorhabdus halotolerans]
MVSVNNGEKETAGGVLAQPWLSVVLPTYCGEKWVATTLDAIAVDPDPGIEIVVVDTSRGPETLEIVARYADTLNLAIYQPVDIDGCSLKTNFGVAQAKADYVTWLCQDDLWLPGRAAAIRRWIEKDTSAVLHLAPTAIIDKDGERLGDWNCPLPETQDPIDPNMLCERLLVQNFIAVVSPVIRREAWIACGGIDPALWYSGDWELWLKLAQAGRVYYHNEVTAAFRIHGESATSTGSRDAEDFRKQLQIVIDRHIGVIDPSRQSDVRKLADAAIDINCALASAANGDASGGFKTVWAIIALGPIGAWNLIKYSRIIERVMPRVRAKLAGAL